MTVRVEHIGDATLYLGDCRDVLPRLAGVDAVVTDPPYGIGFKKGPSGLGHQPHRRRRRLDLIPGDGAPFDPLPLLSWPCAMFGANHFYARLPDGGSFHTWDKSCGVGPNDSFSDAEYLWTARSCKSEVFRYLWKGVLQDGEKGSAKFHPMQKPVAVMGWCLGFVPHANTILDPYMGSGSTGIAAVRLGRKFIGIEVDPGYFDIACRRIEEEARQGRLHLPRPYDESADLLRSSER